MPNHYEWKQGVLTAIENPSSQDDFKDGPCSERLFSYGMPFTIYARPSVQRKFPYQFVCSLTVAHDEYFLWVSDFPALLTLLDVLHVSPLAPEHPDLAETIHQTWRILHGFALPPGTLSKDPDS